MQPDHIKIGTWIVVTDIKKKDTIEVETEFGNTIELQPIPQNFEPTGVPMKVRAISWPFIVCIPVTAPNVLSVVNYSKYKIRKAEPKYVKVFKDNYNLQLALHNGTAENGPIV